jgi:hypothetical protein
MKNRTYHIFVPGFKKAGYTYRTNKAFYARLRALAALKTLTRVNVYVSDLGKWYGVNLNPSADVTWSSLELKQAPEGVEL